MTNREKWLMCFAREQAIHDNHIRSQRFLTFLREFIHDIESNPNYEPPSYEETSALLTGTIDPDCRATW